MIVLWFKALLGAVAVIVIQLLSNSRTYYIAGLVPLFPTFALIAHSIVGTERTIVDLKTTINVSTWALLPYLLYLRALYHLLDCFSLGVSLCLALICWCMATSLLLMLIT